ncbi:MAG: hypothetical protein WCN88_02375 [Candidatus Falkowbacteria bacterium]
MAITKKHVISFLFLAIFSVIQIVVFASSAHQARADEALFNSQTGISDIGKAYGNQDGKNVTDIRVIIGKIIQVVLGFIAAIFLALVIFAGFRYMTAAGNQDQTKKAVGQIRDAVIGLIVVLAAWGITTFVLNAMNWASGASGNANY